MINGTKAIEICIRAFSKFLLKTAVFRGSHTAMRKNAGRDACIGAAFSSYTNQEVI